MNTLIYTPKKLLITILILLASATSLSCHALHLSTYRIYLDPDNRTYSFMVFNRDIAEQNCKLQLRHFDFDESGKMHAHKGKELPANSASDWMRFSPKKFTLTPANSQTIRFTMRRKPKAKAAEYRSYLTIDCEDKNPPDNKQMVTIRPKLMHNVPIIVRTGKLDVNAKFTNVREESKNLSFRIERSGNRSMYGSLQLVNKNSGEVVFKQNGLSLYPETKYQDISLPRLGVPAKDLTIRFVEDEIYGGNKTFKQ